MEFKRVKKYEFATKQSIDKHRETYANTQPILDVNEDVFSLGDLLR